MIYDITAENYKDEISNCELPVMVRFGTPACVPCKLFHSSLLKYSEEKKDTLKILSCNIDDYPEIAEDFGVKGAPTFLIIKGNEVLDSKFGVLPITEFDSWVESVIN